MSSNPNFTAQANERYAHWEQNAFSIFLVLLAIALASAVFYSPHLLVMASCFCAGLAIFGSWRCSMSQRITPALFMALLSLPFALAPLLATPNLHLPVLLAQGFPFIGLGLFSGILFWSKLKGAQ